MFIALFCLAWLAAAVFPQTRFSQVFRKLLVETPALALSRLTAGRTILALIVIATSLAILSLMRSDATAVLAQGLPEGVGWLVTFDIASYVDVAILAVAAAAAISARGASTLARHAIQRLAAPLSRGSARKRRAPRRARPRRPSADDEPGWRVAFA